MKRLLPVLLFAAVPVVAAPPSPPPDIDALAGQAAELPNHGSLKLDLALARAGRVDEALGWLRRAAAMGIGADLGALEAAFGAAAANPAFQEVRRRFQENVSPLARGEVSLSPPAATASSAWTGLATCWSSSHRRRACSSTASPCPATAGGSTSPRTRAA